MGGSAMGILDKLLGRKPAIELARRDVLEPPRGFETGVEAFCWRVIVGAYTRILARHQGRDWLEMPDREVSAMLDPYHADMERDVRALGAAIAQARTEGLGVLHAALHAAPGLDHEMVDEAVAHAYSVAVSAKGTKP